MKHSFVFLMVASALMVTSARATPPTIEDTIRRPEIDSVRLSDDGKRVTFLTPSQWEYFELNVYDVETGQSTKYNLRDDDVISYRWLASDRLLIRSEMPSVRKFRVAIFDVTKGAVTLNVPDSVSIFSALKRDPKLYAAHISDSSRSGPAIFNANRRVLANPEWISMPSGARMKYRLDSEGEIRGVTLYKDRELHFSYRKTFADDWLELPLNFDESTFLGFDRDPTYIWIAHRTADAPTNSLHRYNVDTHDLGRPVFTDPEYSLDDAVYEYVRTGAGKVRKLALTYERTFTTQIALDPEFAEVKKAVDRLLPNRLNTISDCDAQLTQFLISSDSGRDYRHVIYDRQKNTLVALPDPYPWIQAQDVSLGRPLKFTTRDGLQLEGYLTLPAVGKNPAKPPLVVLCRDDLDSRFTWGFSREVHFLTSRGYAVFQPNYRGSGGYNYRISAFGTKTLEHMPHDIVDGVRHLIQQGLVDETKVGIMGKDFGAFTAMATVITEPSLFRCAIAESGYFDWAAMVKRVWGSSVNNDYEFRHLEQRFGSVADNESRFADLSPLNHVDKVKAATLVIYTELDSLPESQSKALLKGLAAHDAVTESVVLRNFPHTEDRFENPRRRLEAIEAFLAKHL